MYNQLGTVYNSISICVFANVQKKFDEKRQAVENKK
jgi:hypothetical protein